MHVIPVFTSFLNVWKMSEYEYLVILDETGNLDESFYDILNNCYT